MTNCIFCDIIAKKLPAHLVAENEYAIAFLPKEMESFAHTLIVPKKHYKNLFDIPENELKNLITFLQNTTKIYQTHLWATGINILNANGKDAQQSVPHLHFHLIPRFSDDHLDLRPDFPPFDAKPEEVLEKIRAKQFISLDYTNPLWKQTINYAQNCAWEAWPLLAQKMENNDFLDWEKVFIVLDNDQIIGFCTFTQEDWIPNCEYSPFIGFLFVDEKYRGQRLSEELINQVEQYAKTLHMKKLYIISDHKWLYEKYGFTKIDESKDEQGRLESIFYRAIQEHKE